MKTVIDATLNTNSITDAIKKIDDHRIELLAKFDIFVNRLASEGVSTLQGYNLKFGKYIYFYSTINVNGNLITAEIVMKAEQMIKAEWLQADGSVKSADVNPVLMEEFGSGFKTAELHAQKSNKFSGMTLGGQGTFPNQTHANDEGGWWYRDIDGDWHHSLGFQATSPLLNTVYDLRMKIRQIEIEVFGL